MNDIVKHVYQCTVTGRYYDGISYLSPVSISGAKIYDIKHFARSREKSMRYEGYKLVTYTQKELFHLRLKSK